MTGRAGGYCAGTGVPDFANTFAGRGFGAGFGRNWPAWGQGLGFGAGRWGRRSMPQVTAAPGRLRFGGYGVPPTQPGPEQEKNSLKNQAEALKADLEIITRRLQALETEEAGE